MGVPGACGGEFGFVDAGEVATVEAPPLAGAAGMAGAEVLLAESREQAALIGKPDQVEVIAAQMQRRDPVFK